MTVNKVGYGLTFMKVVDSEKWKAYTAQAGAIASQYGAKRIAGGEIADVALYAENGSGYDIAVLMEYPSLEDHAKVFYRSEEYQNGGALHLRREAAQGPFLLVEGESRPDCYTGIVVAVIKKTGADMSKYNPSGSIDKYGGKLLFRTPKPPISDDFEGAYDFAVGLAFPTAEKAVEWMKSDDYKEMLDLRLANSTGALVILDAAKAKTNVVQSMSIRRPPSAI